MKLLKLCGLSVGLFLMFGVGVAQAQFTLLPSIPEGTDCNQILNEYELTRDFEDTSAKMSAVDNAEKSIEDTKKRLDETAIQLNEAEKALRVAEEIFNDCEGACGPEQTILINAKGAYEEAKDFNSSALANSSNAVKGLREIDSNYSSRNTVLACAIKTGRVSLGMIPYYITYIADFLLGLSGVVAMLFIIVGGYFYIWGGLTDNKEKGKKTIINAIIGLIFATLSWALVSLVISAITS